MHRDPYSVPIPTRMAKLPRDRRGFPMFYMVHLDPEGRPHFTINDEGKRQHCIANDLCSICGGKLMRGRWFIGGEKSAFHRVGAYIDPPVHAECGHYALLVCPYLASPNYNALIEGKTLKPEHTIPLVLDEGMRDERPPVFAFVMTAGQSYVHNSIAGLKVVRYIRPRKPYSRVEFWRHGERLPYAQAVPQFDDEGQQAVADYIAKHGPIQRKTTATMETG